MNARAEVTGKRDLEMSAWIRQHLPASSSGFMVSDLDFVLYDFKRKRFAMIEVKTRGKSVADWQTIMWRRLSRWISRGIDADWTYYGYNVIRFENTWFNDGAVYWNNVPVNENELRHLMSLPDKD